MSYMVTLKPSARNTYTATVYRQVACGISKVVTIARGKTAADAVGQARRDVRTARKCGGLR